jgi:hypothetical protein
MASTAAARCLRRARKAFDKGKKFNARGKKNKGIVQKILNKQPTKRLKFKQPLSVSKALFERGSKATVTEAASATSSWTSSTVAGECVGFGDFLLDFIDRRGRLHGEDNRDVQIFQNLVNDAVKIWTAKTPGEKQTHVDAHCDAVNILHWASALSDAVRGAPNGIPELVVSPEHLAAPPPAWATAG